MYYLVFYYIAAMCLHGYPFAFKAKDVVVPISNLVAIISHPPSYADFRLEGFSSDNAAVCENGQEGRRQDKDFLGAWETLNMRRFEQEKNYLMFLRIPSLSQ